MLVATLFNVKNYRAQNDHRQTVAEIYLGFKTIEIWLLRIASKKIKHQQWHQHSEW